MIVKTFTFVFKNLNSESFFNLFLPQIYYLVELFIHQKFLQYVIIVLNIFPFPFPARFEPTISDSEVVSSESETDEDIADEQIGETRKNYKEKTWRVKYKYSLLYWDVIQIKNLLCCL